MQWKKKFTRLKAATGHSRARRMLCCGRRKENGRSVPDVTASPGRAPPGPLPSNQIQPMANQHQTQQPQQLQQPQSLQHQQQQQQQLQHPQHHHQSQQPQPRQGSAVGSGLAGQLGMPGTIKDPVMLQGDFRKVSGISSEIFRQIEAVENDHDPNTAAALEAVDRRGEMIVRTLEARSIGGKQAVETAHKLMAKSDARHLVQLVEIVKRPGQTLGLYIREGNGADRTDGVFVSRIALESPVYTSGCLKVGDEILAVNLVDVTHMSLDDVVIIMSIPRRLVLAIRQRRGGNRGAASPGLSTLSRPEQKPPPVVVIKRDLREDDIDEAEHMTRSRTSRERRTGDGREMSESRLGLGLNNYSPQSEQLDLYYNTRAGIEQIPWSYKPPPPPPSVITEQPKSHSFTPSHAYYKNAGTLESLAEKVHSFYPGAPQSSRRLSGSGMSHFRFPRSGSDQHLPRIEYADYSNSLGRHHSLLRSNLKPGVGVPSGPPHIAMGGTLGRYGRYDSRSGSKYGTIDAQTLHRRSRPNLDYSSDTEATVGLRPTYYYYNRPAVGTMPRSAGGANVGGPNSMVPGILSGGASDMSKFNSLPRERPGVRLQGIRPRITDRLMDDADGNISAPEFNARRDRDLRTRVMASPSMFSSEEYRAWLRRAPSSSAIAEQMRITRDLLNLPRSQRFSCSAENIHDALRNTDNIYSSRTGLLGTTGGTLERHLGMPRPISALPMRSMSSQHIGGPSSIRSPSIRRMRQLLELSSGMTGAGGAGLMTTAGHQSPAPTPSATLPRAQRQIDINPAEFSKYKLDKPIVDIGGISGMLWIHLLAGRGLRSAPEIGSQHMANGPSHGTLSITRDLYCVIECDRVHKARTVVRSGDLQFDWDESFELDLVGNRQLDVLVYSWDPQHRHKLCYRGAISLSNLLRQSPLHQLALKVEPRGTIYIRMRHTDPIALYKRRGLPSLRSGYPTLFGADLETVINRECKGAPGSAPVPIVLRRCVEEVERRGLDIIGLYRLCGSATKKRLLREAFERNSRAVELSPEHVPDINVITGVLKDYLRELPEPLFTRCLFQMTVDALAVCLPDDPEGNAKLMLSILDCLPRANRATLVFLLDHLSLVVSNAERNKMSAQALATVMGPPLMLHSASAQPGLEIDHAQPIAVLRYLLQIWPQPQIQHHQANPTVLGSSTNIMTGQMGVGPPLGMGLGMGLDVGGKMNVAPGMGAGMTLSAGLNAGSLSNMNVGVSGRRGESTGQRGSRVNVSQVDSRQHLLMQQQQQQIQHIQHMHQQQQQLQQQLVAAGSLLRSYNSVTNLMSHDPIQLSTTIHNSQHHLYQSVVGQLAQSPRVLPQAVLQPRQLVDSAVLAIPGQLQLPPPGTPSPGSSSTSTGSASGSGSGRSTDTIKRGASPPSSRVERIADKSYNQSAAEYNVSSVTSTTAATTITTVIKSLEASTASNINITATTTTTAAIISAFTTLTTPATATATATATISSTANHKAVEFFDTHKTILKNDDDNNLKKNGANSNDVSDLDRYKTRSSALRSLNMISNGLNSVMERPILSTEEYKRLRSKQTGAISSTSSSSSVATVVGTGSANTSDESDDLLSYKSSASMNALLAQSQAMTTTQLMSKYLKREPRVQFTPIKSPESPTSANLNGPLKGTYQLISTTGSSTNNFHSRLSKNSAGNTPNNVSTTSNSTNREGGFLSALGSTSALVSTGRRLFDSLSTEPSAELSSQTNDNHKSNASNNSLRTEKNHHHTTTEQRSFGSSLFGGGERSSYGIAANFAMKSAAHLYGTLPKNGTNSNGSHSNSAMTHIMEGNSNSVSQHHETVVNSSQSSGNYHTLGTYRVQYAATNPFLDAFEVNSGNGSNDKTNEMSNSLEISNHSGSDNGGGSKASLSSQRTAIMTALHTAHSKSGSDEYEDLK